MTTNRKIDEIDAKILKDLLIDGRKEFTEIAREIQVSKDVIWQHYNNMKKERIIIGSTIQLNYAALGYDVSASFFIKVPIGQQQQVEEQLRKIPGIYDAYRWGSHSQLWAVSDLMKAEQIEQVKQLIKKVPSVLKSEVEIWTGTRNTPENLSVLADCRTPRAAEKTEMTNKIIQEEAIKIDEIDKQLIKKLSVNSRASFNRISKELKISPSTTIRRYNKLKRNHIIKSLIQINPAKIGYPVEACFKLTIQSQENLTETAKKIAEVPDVRGVIKTAGSHDLCVFAAIKNFDHLFALENEIASIQGIREIATPVLNPQLILPYRREHLSTF